MITKLKIKRQIETDEWVVVVSIDGVIMEDKCYYTDDKEDAEETLKAMKKEYGIQ